MNKPMSLECWSKDVSPILSNVSWYAYRARQFADLTNIEVQRLQVKAPFDTKAEADMLQAKMSLEAALARVTQSLEQVAALPVDGAAAA